MSETVEQVASDLQRRIESLANFDGESLRGEMAALKTALLENPSAAALLLPEDIGAAVSALRRINGIAIAAASAPKEKKATAKKSKAMTAAELQAALSSISEDEL